jgi:hypothetical protein
MEMSKMILVDTEDLEKRAKRLTELGGIFDDMGGRMNAVCLGVPSYGGQLGNPARNAATQILYETGLVRDAFLALGENLKQTAEQFERTDRNSIEAWLKFYSDSLTWWINYFKYFFTGKGPLDGDMIHGYRELLAYEENGTVVTIWYAGTPLSFDLADPSLSPEEREALREKLERFRECMQECLTHLMNYLGGDAALFGVAISLLGMGLNVKDLLTTLSKLGYTSGQYLGDETELRLSEEAFNEAVSLWQELNAGDVPGKVPTP